MNAVRNKDKQPRYDDTYLSPFEKSRERPGAASSGRRLVGSWGRRRRDWGAHVEDLFHRKYVSVLKLKSSQRQTGLPGSSFEGKNPARRARLHASVPPKTHFRP